MLSYNKRSNDMVESKENHNIEVMFQVSKAVERFNQIDPTWRAGNLGKLLAELIGAGLDDISAIIFVQKMGYDYSDRQLLDMRESHQKKLEIWAAVDGGAVESPSGEW